MNMDLDAATKEAPTLTLDPFAEAKAEIVEKKPEELVEEQAVPEMELTPEEQKMVDDFAGQIDLTNTQYCSTVRGVRKRSQISLRQHLAMSGPRIWARLDSC